MKYCIQIVNFDFVAGVLNAAYGILDTAKGRTIRKVMGGMGKKPKKNSCKEKWQEKKFVQRRRERKKIPSEGRSNCDSYLIYKICQQAC